MLAPPIVPPLAVRPELTFGGQPHPVALSSGEFAIGYAVGNSPPSELDVAFFDSQGQAEATRRVSDDSTLFPGGTGVSVAAMGKGMYVAGWTDYDDGDGSGVTLRLVDARSPLSSLIRANLSTDFDQSLQDMIWTGSELVVAWSDDGDISGLGALKVRTFDASLQPTSDELPLASSSGQETFAVLAPWAGAWAAAWLSLNGGAGTIKAVAGPSTWSVGPFSSDALVDRPALAQIDSTHLLLAYTLATTTPGQASIFGAILDQAAPGAVVSFPISSSDPAALPTLAREPTATRIGACLFVGWSATADGSDAQNPLEQVWLKEVPLDSSGAIDLSRAAIPLSWPSAVGPSQQRFPVLAAPVDPEHVLVAAWQDTGLALGWQNIVAAAHALPVQ